MLGVPITDNNNGKNCKSSVHTQQGKRENIFQRMARKIYECLDQKQQKVQEALNYNPFKVKE
jgi:hypothetical protein